MSTLVTVDKFSSSECLQLIESEQITMLNGVPTIFILLLENSDFYKYDLSSLRTCRVGGSPVSSALVKRMEKEMNVDVQVGYGTSEANIATMTLPNDTEEHKLKTIGLPCLDYKMKIVDENRKELGPNEVGEIAIKGKNVFVGYFRKDEETKKVLDDKGWFYTGDLGKKGEDGYIYFIGRKTEMYIRGGVNIYPREIEAVLDKHPKIQFSAVLPIPDRVMGEEGRAYILPRLREEVNSEEIIGYCRLHLADHKIPKEIIIREQLPLTGSGKIKKSELEKEIMDEFQII
jgi:acyl-CoA synthetase (AMP-forming)/AMP-acid ligase II